MLNEAAELHSELNPKIWNSDATLKEDVASALLTILDTYIEQSELLTTQDVIDAQIVGSNASFNYNDNSDIDLHIIVNMDNMSCDSELFQLACNSEKSSFNKNHDIKIRGIDVELYVEDVNASTMSNGIYSLFGSKWIKFPQPIPPVNYDEDDEYKTLLSNWLSLAQQKLDQTASANDIREYIDQLYNLRRNSLLVDGEFGKGNLVFKEIRNQGLLDKLKDRYNQILDKELSLENLRSENLKLYRVYYTLNEEFHYSDMIGNNEIESAEKVFDYFNNADTYEFLGVEPIDTEAKLIEPGPKSGMAGIINSLIIDEYEAIKGYNDASVTAQQEGFIDAAKLLSDLSKEEIVHVGELQELMKSFDANANAVAEGEVEAKQELEGSEDGIEN